MQEFGFFHPDKGYFQVVGGDPVATDYLEGTVAVPLKPSARHIWNDGGWVYVEPIPQSPEDIRQAMPQLSMVDFRRKLRGIKVVERIIHHPEYEVEDPETGEVTLVQPEPTSYMDGIYEEDILEKIAIISDKELQAEARDYFMFAQYIERINPWVEILGGMFDITPDEIDAFWLG